MIYTYCNTLKRLKLDFDTKLLPLISISLLSVENSCTNPTSPAELSLCIAHYWLALRTGSAVMPCEPYCKQNDVMIKGLQGPAVLLQAHTVIT